MNDKLNKAIISYIGSKRPILDFLIDAVETKVKHKIGLSFCDMFAGTNVVGATFKKLGYKVISNDLMYYSYVLGKYLIENDEVNTVIDERVIELANELDSLKGEHGLISENFSPLGKEGRMYFTPENAMKGDAIRLKIERWKRDGVINENEYYLFLSSLISALDKIANTTSVYAAFLKEFKPEIRKPLEFSLLPVIKGKAGIAYNLDANELIKKISGDVLYLDPPYNHRQYSQNYHALETICLYDDHKLSGISGVRNEPSKKSDYCKKTQALLALENLLSDAKFTHTFMSYSTHGMMELEKIKTLFEKYFDEIDVFEKQHRVYKSNNNKTLRSDPLKEIIFYGKK